MTTLRATYLVCYDVADDKRLRKTREVMMGYGDALQYSVFKCLLSEREKAMMMMKLIEVVHPREDRIMIVDLGSGDQVLERVEFIGTPLSSIDTPETIII